MFRPGLFRTITAFLILAALACDAEASIQLPSNMTKGDRIEALRIIGLGTASKILSDPFPLGGYSGFEAGFSIESFPADDLARLGSGIAPPQQNTSLSRLSIGKGLYNNIDIFIQFTPYNQQEEISQFGGLVRWGFYQATYLPLSLSAVVHSNSSNIASQLSASSRGLDLIGGVDADNLAIFAGFGLAEATGTFTGGPGGVTAPESGSDQKYEATEFVSAFHTVIGGNLKFSNVFVALQIDRYTLPVYSGKVGIYF